jgi:hypothetical protein
MFCGFCCDSLKTAAEGKARRGDPWGTTHPALLSKVHAKCDRSFSRPPPIPPSLSLYLSPSLSLSFSFSPPLFLFLYLSVSIYLSIYIYIYIYI